jgi:Ser/Thr protein kinase RdoA (MazF antagonist)
VRIVMLEQADRTLVVKRVDADSLGRRLADGLRGAAAARAFEAGQKLALLGELAPLPLAHLEERTLGLPRRSWLVLEAVGDEDLDRFHPASPEIAFACARALGAWLAELHAWGLQHLDLKASNVRLRASEGGFHFWWLDLEDVRLGARLDDTARVRALAQLNASLAEEAFPTPARLAGFEAYRARLPFEAGSAEILRRIAVQSLARKHRWHGESCALGRAAPVQGGPGRGDETQAGRGARRP